MNKLEMIFSICFITVLFTAGFNSVLAQSAYDDEFNGSIIDSKWTQYNTSSGNLSVSNGNLVIASPGASSNFTRGLYQPRPDGDFSITAKFTQESNTPHNYWRLALMLRNSSTNKLIIYGFEGTSGELNARAQYYSDWGNWDGQIVNTVITGISRIYFKIIVSGSNIAFYCSTDGITWILTGGTNTAYLGSFNQIGLYWYDSITGLTMNGTCDWFRVTDLGSGNGSSSNNSSVNFSNTASIADGNSSQALLFNAYKSSTQLEGDLSVFGNTKYSSDRGANFSGAGSIMFMDDGGNMNFFVSPEAPEINGKDQDINWGSPKMIIKRTGKIGIGTSTPDKLLTVNGSIHSKEVIVDVNVQPDFVFEKDYKLMPIKELESYVTKNKHLPEIPSASEVKQNGVSLGDSQSKLLQKIEELTLYVIDLKKEINDMKNENRKLKKRFPVSNKSRK